MTTSWICYVLVLWILQTDGKTISFSDLQFPLIYTVDSDIKVVWNGSRFGGGESHSCKISFIPAGDSESVCVEVESFQIKDCNVYVKYYFVDTKTYGCSFTPPKYCSNLYHDISIQVSIGPRLLSSTGENSFQLKVYSPKRTNYIWIIVLAGFGLSFIIGGIVIAFICLRKRSTGTVLGTSEVPHTRLVECTDKTSSNSNDEQQNPNQEHNSNQQPSHGQQQDSGQQPYPYQQPQAEPPPYPLYNL